MVLYLPMSNVNDFKFIDDLHIVVPGSSLDDEARIYSSLEELNAEIFSTRSEIVKLQEKLHSLESKKEALSEKMEKLTFRAMEIELGRPTLTMHASAIDKARFLLNLFQGRSDVYASRNWNEKAGRVSYFPVCRNAWSDGCLLKSFKDNGSKGPKPSCSDCNRKRYECLFPETIIARNLCNYDEHGNKAVGLYAMLPGNNCRFVAIDLDEATWRKDALAIVDVARRAGFQMAIEQSFSGDGAHLWLFFDEDIPASKARRLAFSFLDEACKRSKTIRFKSYDRVFPSQDSIEDGGLGNLILMPLVAGAAKRQAKKGTVFVDNGFNVFPDQISFLSSVPKYSEQQIDFHFATHDEPFIDSSVFWNDDVEKDVLWSRRIPKVSQKDCLSKVLPVFLSAGISIPKSVLGARLQDALKRLACFLNPEYFKSMKRNQGFAPRNIESFVETFVESEDVIQLPRGLRSSLEHLLKKGCIDYEIMDLRSCNTGLDVEFSGTLRRPQVGALDSLMKVEMGIMNAATSFGKTIVAAKLIAQRHEKTLVLVQRQNLMEQWKDTLGKFLSVGNPPLKRTGKRLNKTGIGVYGGSKDSLTSYVDIAMVQTLASRMPEFIRDYGMVIVDECHHMASDSFLKVMNAVRPKYVYGLSATIRRLDGLERLIYSQCGPVVFKYGADKLAYERGLVQEFVPRFTQSMLSVCSGRKFNLMEALKEISEDEIRNDLIVDDACSLKAEGKKILILTRLVEHARKLEMKLLAKDVPVVVLTGAMKSSEQVAAWSTVEKSRGSYLIVSTGQYLGEGVDIPYLDTLLIASPVGWEGVVSQYVGRISRMYDGKDGICIYDYVDVCVPQFVRMYNKRLSTYRKLGFIGGLGFDNRNNRSEVDESASSRISMGKGFYSQYDLFDSLLFAMKSASKSIVISSPLILSSNSTKSIVREIFDLQGKGVFVEVRSLPVEESYSPDSQMEILECLRRGGVSLSIQKSCYLRFVVLDESEVFFGDLDVLGSLRQVEQQDSKLDQSKQNVMIHILNAQVAKALLRTSELVN